MRLDESRDVSGRGSGLGWLSLAVALGLLCGLGAAADVRRMEAVGPEPEKKQYGLSATDNAGQILGRDRAGSIGLSRCDHDFTELRREAFLRNVKDTKATGLCQFDKILAAIADAGRLGYP